MFADYLYEMSSAEYSNRVLLFDNDDLENRTKYSEYFAANGFSVIRYQDDLDLRLKHDDAISDRDLSAEQFLGEGVFKQTLHRTTKRTRAVFDVGTLLYYKFFGQTLQAFDYALGQPSHEYHILTNY